jgi:hypothetical protein
LVSCWVDRLLDTVSTGGVFELGEHAAKPSLEAASLGRSKLIGDDKVGKVQ